MGERRKQTMSIDATNPDDLNPRASRRLSAESAGTVDELQLQRYLDGRLTTRERLVIDDLLKTSAAARRTLDALREEESLLRDALESRIEPSRRAGDKVMVTLHNEERFRLHALRNKRLRRQVVGIMAAAACLFLIVWLVKPREAAGTQISGTLATVITPNNDKKRISRSASIYEGDQIVTTTGEFIRVLLAGGAILDMDENSKATIGKGAAASVQVDAGRIGLDLRNARADVYVYVPQGTALAATGSHLDVWLPGKKAEMRWPEMLVRTPAGAAPAATTDMPAIITVISGSAHVGNQKYPEGLKITEGQRTFLTPTDSHTDLINIAASQVFDSRNEKSWHASEGAGPGGYTLIGLLDRPHFLELATALKLTQKDNAALHEALRQLQGAMATIDAAQRAEKLAAGQTAIRNALAALNTNDQAFQFGRMLEGLAHFDRGQTLLRQEKPDRSAANAAFAAAAVAFEEAQQQVSIPGLPTVARERFAWAAQLIIGDNIRTLNELAPIDHSDLRSAFNHAVAVYWRLQTSSEDDDEAAARNVAQEFSDLRAKLGRSIESLAARLGEALSYKLAGKREKTIDALQQLLSVNLEGSIEAPRAAGDGIKQAALLELVRLHIESGDKKKAHDAAHDFKILFPLDADSPVAKEIESLLEVDIRKTVQQNGDWFSAAKL
jgi:hypothetical protein